MTRDEEILTACKGFLSRYPSIDQAGLSIGFLDGAVWSDKHPVNVWHDASEEPLLEGKDIIFLNEQDKTFISGKFGGAFSFLHEDFYWENFVKLVQISKWAYISDLLPKQFGNSERLKGEHNGNND